jgi:hypothetical protein
MEEHRGLSARRAARLPDEREARKVRQARREQGRQRLDQMALGYADGKDAARLRHEPLLPSVWERTSPAGGLSSHPTRSRLENAVDARTLRAVLREIAE